MEEYYFKTSGSDKDWCMEKCYVKNDGTMIGSVTCQECQFCVDKQKTIEDSWEGPRWIKCSKLDEAITSK